jgi:hypothetical protein
MMNPEDINNQVLTLLLLVGRLASDWFLSPFSLVRKFVVDKTYCQSA